MAFTLPELPFGRSDLAPHISEDTIDYHYGKHHATYVKNLNDLVAGTDHESQDLEALIKDVAGDADKVGIFNNSAQVWNHTFYWHS